MFVILIQGINRNLPMTDWTQFMWLASHPTETFINQAEEPSQVNPTTCHILLSHTKKHYE